MSKTAKQLNRQLFGIKNLADLAIFSTELTKAEEEGTLESQELYNLKYMQTRAMVWVGTLIIQPNFENMFSRMAKEFWEVNQ